jgi:hypothetical protein
MSDERPIDLRALDATEPEVLKASIRRFRRRVLTWVAWGLVFAAAAAAIFAATVRNHQSNVEAQFAAAPVLNDAIGNYFVGGADVGLLKVARISGNRFGMQFVVHSDGSLGDCCNIFPQEALSDGTIPSTGGGRFREVLVVLPDSAAAGGAVHLRLVSAQVGALGSFTVDLRSLHVEGIGG